MTEKSEQKMTNWKRIYWFVFALGVLFILLLGLFTFLFNNPV